MLVLERRFSPRVKVFFPARLKGIDASGRTFREDAVLDNLGDGGVYLRLTREVKEGSGVMIAARLSSVSDPRVPALRLAAHGTVVRTEAQSDDTWGVAVEFRRRRVL